MTHSADCDARPEMTCPVAHCGADLYLTITSCIPLYRINPPWPGAGEATYGPEDAVSDGWEVTCTDGHTLWTSVDQIRVDNAAGLTDDDETGDSAPTFRPEAMCLTSPVEPRCGTCFTSGWYGSREGADHLHCDCGAPCQACPTSPGGQS